MPNFLSTHRIRYTKALDSIKALRKDRLADLKADKERLESLSREKGHADKLRARIAELNTRIASKELAYEEAKSSYDQLVTANQKFYDYATKFRELYINIENLQKRKVRFEEELADGRENLQEVEGEYLRCRLGVGGLALLMQDVRHGRGAGGTPAHLQ